MPFLLILPSPFTLQSEDGDDTVDGKRLTAVLALLREHQAARDGAVRTGAIGTVAE